MAQGGTTAIKPSAPLQMPAPNEQRWARELDNNRQATAVADSLMLENQDLSAQNSTENINQNLIQGETKMNFGSIKDALSQTTEIAGQQIFKKFLKQSWYNLVDSYGLTIIYINFHFIMAYLAKNKYFCKFGVALSFGGEMDALSNADGGISQTLTEYAEIIILLAVDALILFILLLVACIISLIVQCSSITGAVSCARQMI